MGKGIRNFIQKWFEIGLVDSIQRIFSAMNILKAKEKEIRQNLEKIIQEEKLVSFNRNFLMLLFRK